MSNEKMAIRKDDPRERYLYDAEFRTLVDAMLKLVENCQFTPFELKQALNLALTMHEELTLRPLPFKSSPRVDTPWENDEELERKAPPKTIKQLLSNLFGKKEEI